jgi:hypothetical protein
MKQQLNGGLRPLVRSVVYRDYKKLQAELTEEGRREAESVARRLMDTFNDRFREVPDLQGGEPKVLLTIQGDVVYRYPPQTVKNVPLDY